MRPLIKAELARLRKVYGEVEHMEVNGEDWFKIGRYPLPDNCLVNGAEKDSAPVAFLIKADYPGGSPYGFLTPSGLSLSGSAPKNTGAAPGDIPFEGEWMLFSWHCEDWPARVDGEQGPDLVRWSRSFRQRFSEGA